MDHLSKAFQFALILLVSGTGALMWKQAITVQDFPTGWATLLGPLVGALIGGLAIAWQAKVGLQNIQSSQERQAEIDREARKEQIDYDRARDAERFKIEAKALSAALRGELFALANLFADAKQLLDDWGNNLKNFRYGLPTFLIKVPESPKFDCSVYLGNSNKLGILGPATSMNVALLYGTIMSVRSIKVLESSSQDIIIFECEKIIKSYSNIIEEITYVVLGLQELEEEKPSHGSLFMLRQLRKKIKE